MHMLVSCLYDNKPYTSHTQNPYLCSKYALLAIVFRDLIGLFYIEMVTEGKKLSKVEVGKKRIITPL